MTIFYKTSDIRTLTTHNTLISKYIQLRTKNKYEIWKSNSEQIPYEKCHNFEIT
jgi:hypothetical protein